MKLKEKVALITGAARGIGRAHAFRLARLGADIVINDINLKSYEEFDEEITADSVMDEVRRLGVECIGLEADVGQKDEAEAMVRRAVEEFGHVDILVNNAGGLAGSVAESFAASVSEEDLRATLDRNLMGTIYCCQAVAEHMKARKWGRIVNTSSQAGLRAQPGGVYASYGAAKAGVIAYTRYLAQELGPYGITVNCIAPAYVRTERLWRQSFSQVKDVGTELRVPLGRLAEPDDNSKVVEFFVTDLGDYVTGQCLSVCGGAVNF
ncbi:MAG: SDR family oxidoreductase [Deltaproteobacteria bacterium]|nr:SDR family oxidoreductase [Deltaproteobacteria bacterium]